MELALGHVLQGQEGSSRYVSILVFVELALGLERGIAEYVEEV